jgi:bifunctional DNA-binding transcriptional regulator/antitoxin component of YhaV-PrlF toxin-antitoxin module
VRVIVDEKGRLQLPAEVRREARIEPGVEVDVSADAASGQIIVLAVPPRCAVCGAQGPLLAEFGTDPVRHICTTCTDQIACHLLAFNPTTKG